MTYQSARDKSNNSSKGNSYQSAIGNTSQTPDKVPDTSVSRVNSTADITPSNGYTSPTVIENERTLSAKKSRDSRIEKYRKELSEFWRNYNQDPNTSQNVWFKSLLDLYDPDDSDIAVLDYLNLH